MQRSLLARTENEGKPLVLPLRDLSKVFDCFPLEMLIAKLDVFGLNMKSLRVIFDYLRERDLYSTSCEVLFCAEL